MLNIQRLTTTRLRAEKLKPEHLDDLYKLRSDPEVMVYMGGAQDYDFCKAYLTKQMAHWDAHGFGLWLWRTPDGAMVGIDGIRTITIDERDEVEVAYALHKNCWGQGLAAEIALASVEVAQRIGFGKPIAIAQATNLASQAVMRKIGMRYEKDILHFGTPCVLFRLSLV